MLISSCPFYSQEYPGLNGGVAQISFTGLERLSHTSHKDWLLKTHSWSFPGGLTSAESDTTLRRRLWRLHFPTLHPWQPEAESWQMGQIDSLAQGRANSKMQFVLQTPHGIRQKLVSSWDHILVCFGLVCIFVLFSTLHCFTYFLSPEDP